jgi:hypothetical protein
MAASINQSSTPIFFIRHPRTYNLASSARSASGIRIICTSSRHGPRVCG